MDIGEVKEIGERTIETPKLPERERQPTPTPAPRKKEDA